LNAIGVDVGGTKIAAGLVTPEGGVLNEVRYPTADEPKRLVKSIAQAVQEVGDGCEVGGVCLPAPGLILAQENKGVFSPNLHSIEGIPLKDELESEIGLKITIENDASAALARDPDSGEHVLGN
jgi:glucokinase